MRYSYIDIKAFFEKCGFPMNGPYPEHDYIESKMIKGLCFVIKTSETSVEFFWQVKKGETLLDDKLPAIKRLYAAAETKPGSDNPKDWTRLFIAVDSNQPLAAILEILEKTKGLLGYSGTPE